MLKLILALTLVLNPVVSLAQEPHSVDLLLADAASYAAGSTNAFVLSKRILQAPKYAIYRTGVALGEITASSIPDAEKILKIKELETVLNGEIARLRGSEDSRSFGGAGLGAVLGMATGFILTGYTGNGGPFDVMGYILIGPILMTAGAGIGAGIGALAPMLSDRQLVEGTPETIAEVVRKACDKVLKP